ncbi:MAG: hypothetical protein FIB07_13130 [Candidatus Methanoperedens sp.]|nr:hypothetical protein [Candidatus Methanoperedens sp.]
MPVEKVPSWIKQVLMPELNEIKGELKSINTRIDSVEAQIVSLRNETKSEIVRIEDRIDSLRKEMISKFETTDNKFEITHNKIETLNKIVTIKFESLEQRIPVIEKITVLELKIAEIEKRLAVA